MGNYKTVAIVIAVAVVLVMAATAGAFSVNTNTHSLTILDEKIQDDGATVTILDGEAQASSNRNENGLTCPGREAAGNNPVLRNDLVKDNWQYRMAIQEALPDSWPAGTIYKVEVFGDAQLLTTLYFDNSNANATAVEGVDMRVDVGSSTSKPGKYSTIISRLATCP